MHTGVLLSYVSFNCAPVNQCVIQKLAPLTFRFDEPCTDEFDCPLLCLTNYLCVIIPVSPIIKSVFVLHPGTKFCNFSLFSWNVKQ